jgi:neurexin
VESCDLTLRFRTGKKTSTIFQLTTQTPDYIEISVEQTRLKLRLRLGDREKTLLTGRDLNDNNWHIVTLHRRGNQIKFQVDDVPPLNGEVLTRSWVMRPVKIEIGSITTAFSGEVQGVIYNKEELTFNAPPKRSNLILSPVSFKSKDAYVGLGQLKAYWKADIYFNVKTVEPEGVVLFNSGRGSEYFCIEISDGRISVSYSVGEGSFFQAVSNVVVNNNLWHFVHVKFDHAGVGSRMTVGVADTVRFQHFGGNQQQNKEQMNINSMQFLDLNGVLYLGGFGGGEVLHANILPNIARLVRIEQCQFLQGCANVRIFSPR